MTHSLSFSYVGKSAVGFGERERTAIFSVAMRRLFEREKNWSWSFALNFVSFVQAKENERVKNLNYS